MGSRLRKGISTLEGSLDIGKEGFQKSKGDGKRHLTSGMFARPRGASRERGYVANVSVEDPHREEELQDQDHYDEPYNDAAYVTISADDQG